MPYFYATNDDGNEVLKFRDDEGNVRRTYESDSQAITQWQETQGIYSPDSIYEKAITGPNGQQYIPAFSTVQGGIRFTSDLEAVREGLRQYEGSIPGVSDLFIGPDGNVYMPRIAADTIGKMSNSGGGFIKQFLNGPGAVLLPLVIATAGTALAAAAPTAGAASTGAGGAAANTLGLTQMGQAAGLSGSALETFVASGGTMGSIAAGGGGVGLGAAAAGAGAEVTGGGLAGFEGTQATTYALGEGVGTVTGTPLAAGAAGAGVTAGTLTAAAGKVAAGTGLASILTSLGVSAETAATIASALPGVTAASLLAGGTQAVLGYLGADKQADAYESAADKQNAAIREAAAASEKARVEQNAAYAKAYEASVAARGVQNSYIQQAIDEVKRGQVSQDAAIQSGIDYSKGASDKYFGLGAQYRDQLANTYKSGYSVFDDSATRDAATQAANYAARGYSATSGNPFDQPAAQGGIYRDVLAQVALPQLNKTRDQLGSFGQIGLTQAGAMDQLTTSGLASLGNNDMAAAPYIASLGANAFQGINYLANQADSGKYTDYLASIGANAFQGVQNAGSGLNAIGAGVSTALNPPLTKNDLLEFMKTYKPTA